MSTSNVQNLLANVLRPVYAYDGTNFVFTTSLELSNIGTYYGNTISVQTLAFGDSNNNVYVGSYAGRTDGDLGGANNVTLGYAAGFNIVNVSNSVYIGSNTSTGVSDAFNVVAIGANSTGGGSSNVFLGNDTGGAGQSNVFVGASNTGTGSNMILIGTAIAGNTSNNLFRLGSNYLYGNQSTKWLGVGVSTPTSSSTKLDISGIVMASGGYASVTGTVNNAGIGSTTTIGTLKKGVILVSAQDAASTSHYQTIQVYCLSATDGANTIAMTNVTQLGEVTITFPSGSSNIQISNANTARNIAWSITYFPTP